jgi:hypothetical protein
MSQTKVLMMPAGGDSNSKGNALTSQSIAVAMAIYKQMLGPGAGAIS